MRTDVVACTYHPNCEVVVKRMPPSTHRIHRTVEHPPSTSLLIAEIAALRAENTKLRAELATVRDLNEELRKSEMRLSDEKRKIEAKADAEIRRLTLYIRLAGDNVVAAMDELRQANDQLKP